MPQYQVSKHPQRQGHQGAEREPQGSLLDFIDDFCQRFPKNVDDYETLLTDNRIWKQRTVGIGVVTPERALNLGFTGRCCAARALPGTCARSSPTTSTTKMDFDVPVGVNGDTYDRYLVRIEEMRQSNRIIQQCVDGCVPTRAR
jgi:NADH-quinone oxidoreductase subunit D